MQLLPKGMPSFPQPAKNFISTPTKVFYDCFFTQSTCVMHALRAGRGAHCPSVFVCVAHLSLEMTALFIYLFTADKVETKIGPVIACTRTHSRTPYPKERKGSSRRLQRAMMDS